MHKESIMQPICDRELHEECGVFGIYDRAGTEDVAAAAYSALYALQHRGQESCGIAVNDDGVITGHRDLGLVNEVFTPEMLASLSTTTAHMATGHVRYATAGTRVRANAQPMIVRHGRGTMALCHNGNLTNAVELRRQLENEGAIFHGSSDTEVICYLITRNRLRMGSIETAISKTMDVLEGAYSLVIMSATKLIAVRDPRGYRPLCIGTLPGGGYVWHLDIWNFHFDGEAWKIDTRQIPVRYKQPGSDSPRKLLKFDRLGRVAPGDHIELKNGEKGENEGQFIRNLD